MTTATDVIALETDHLLQVYRRGPVVFERGRGCRLFDADGRALSRPDLGRRRRVARARASAAGGGDRRPGARAAAHVEPVLPPAAGRAGGAAVGALGAAARVLLQQRHGSGRSVPEVRAPVLARAGGRPPRTGFVALEHSFHGRTMGSLSVTWDDHYRAPFAPLVPDVQFVPTDDPRRSRAAVTDRHRRGHRRADPGRRRRAAAQQRDGRRDHRGLPRDRRAAHRRRSAVRPRPDGRAVLLERARADAGPDGARQGARRGRADRRGDVHATASPRPPRPAITAAPTAATCWRAAPRWCSSRS